MESLPFICIFWFRNGTNGCLPSRPENGKGIGLPSALPKFPGSPVGTVKTLKFVVAINY